MTDRFADNPAYVQYQRLAVRLHEAIAAYGNGSDEADALRDQMDEPWKQLDAGEVTHLRGISADLYMLDNDEVLEPEVLPSLSPEARRSEVEAAKEKGDAEAVLALLRKGPAFLNARVVATYRAWAYQVLGDVEVARLFDRYTRELPYLDGRKAVSL